MSFETSSTLIIDIEVADVPEAPEVLWEEVALESERVVIHYVVGASLRDLLAYDKRPDQPNATAEKKINPEMAALRVRIQKAIDQLGLTATVDDILSETASSLARDPLEINNMPDVFFVQHVSHMARRFDIYYLVGERRNDDDD